MTAGLSATGFANLILDALETGTPNLGAKWAQLHTGDPGSDGTANASAETDRQEATWGTAADGANAITNTPEWANWDQGTETLTHVSMWSADTSGTFRFSAEANTPQEANDDDTVRLTGLTFTFTPIAA